MATSDKMSLPHHLLTALAARLGGDFFRRRRERRANALAIRMLERLDFIHRGE